MMSAALAPLYDLIPELPMITLNGCYVSHPEIYHAGLDSEILGRLSGLLIDSSFATLLLKRDSAIMSNPIDIPLASIGKWVANISLCKDLRPHLDDDITEILVTAEKPAMDVFHSEAERLLDGIADVLFISFLRFMNLWYCEIRAKNVNKGTALKALMSHLGLREDEVLIAGDYHNDIEFFECAVHRAAPSNAVPEILELATYISPKSCDEDAVSDILFTLFFSVYLINAGSRDRSRY
jgi:hydroxymethylpyrimidine pyrophosphatase-like HAD family hydrolase